ncbi:hypothetical protein TGAM01_v210179, partial [Trichoderma gamsii]
LRRNGSIQAVGKKQTLENTTEFSYVSDKCRAAPQLAERWTRSWFLDPALCHNKICFQLLEMAADNNGVMVIFEAVAPFTGTMCLCYDLMSMSTVCMEGCVTRLPVYRAMMLN